MTSDAILDIQDLTFERPSEKGGFQLYVPKLELDRSDKLALIGASGSGKSTLLDVLGLILEPKRVGRFVFWPRDGEAIDIARTASRGRLDRFARLRRRAIGYILQEGGLLPFLSVLDNIRLVDRSAERWKVDELAGQLGIDKLLNRKPIDISAGQRQRVAIARAVVANPALILADEPTAALDPPAAVQAMELLVELVEKAGASLIVASHDLPLIDRFNFRYISPKTEECASGAKSIFA